MKAALLLSAIIFFAPHIVDAEGRFEKFPLKVNGEITNIITEDLNDDGLMEVLVVHRDRPKDDYDRLLTIFWHDSGKGFRKKNMTLWRIPAEVAAIDVGDVRPEKGRELVFITEKGVYSSIVKNKKVGPLKEIIPVQSVVAIASDRHAPYYNFVRDYTGDGRDDLLVCGFSDTLIAIQGDGYKFKTQRINLKPDIELFAFEIKQIMISPENPFFRVTYSVPQIYSEDYNADGLKDLLVSFHSRISIYAQGKDGFSRDPVKEYKIKLLEEETRRRRSAPPNVEFGDLDGDGRVDILAHQMAGNISNIKSRDVLYWGNSDNIEKGIPDIEFITEKTVIAGAFIEDVNGDGLEDIMMPTYALNMWSGGKILITGEISVEWAYFIQSEDRNFNNTPDRVITTDLKFNVGKFRLESGIPNVAGDFNGDGISDQALGEDEQVLVITLRDKDGAPLEIEEHIDVPVSMINRVADLNNDGLSDIVIFYFEQPERTGELNILMNRGPWTLEQ